MSKWKNVLKRSIVLTLTAVLIGSGVNSAVLPVSAEETGEILQGDEADAQAAAVQQQIAALPTVEAVQTSAQEEQDAYRIQLQEADAAYQALTEEQKQQVPGAQEILDALSGYFAGQSVPAEETQQVKEEVVEFTIPVPEEAMSDESSEELLDGYVEQLIYAPFNSGIALFGNVGEDRLGSELDKQIYKTLKDGIKKVAAGTWTSTVFSLSEISFTLTAAEVSAAGGTVEAAFSQKIHTGKILSYLLMDCPYELYWFNKEQGAGMGIRYASQGNPSTGEYRIGGLEISFYVAKEYQQSGQNFVVDSSRVTQANKAIENAQAIVANNKNLPDEDKLRAYKDEICGLVKYNTGAASTSDTPYGDPWQLIYVFDRDSTTDVVCEGYSKAFQYLCDLSDFRDSKVCCYTVTGYMGGGAHMWNVVTMEDGKNYLVDVTNCDEGTTGYPDQLFLAGGTGSVDGGYGVNGINYVYDTDQKGLFGAEILTLSASAYSGKLTPKLTIPASIEVTYGDVTTAYPFGGNGFKATIESGTAVPGTFSWSETSYGDAGEKTLTLVFTPEKQDTYNIVRRSVPVKVNPLQITPTLEITNQTVDYTGQAIIPAHRLSNGQSVLQEGIHYTVQCTDNIDAGTATLKAIPKAGGNYTWDAAAVTGNFTIRPITYAGEKTAAISTRYGKSGSFDFAEMLPSSVALTLAGTEDEDQILAGTPKLEGKVFSYSLVNEKAKVGKTAVVTFTATSRNYHEFTVTLTIKMNDKLTQSDFRFSADTQKKTYGDADYVIAATGAAKGSSVTYTSSDPTVATVDAATGSVHILKPGTTVIRAVASETDDYLEASGSYELQVARKTLSWDVSGLQAVDKAGTVSDRKASLYGVLRVSGILSGDTAYVTFDCPAEKLSGIYASTNPGSQKVTLSWAEEAVLLQGAKADYYVMPEALPELSGRINPVSDRFPTPAESTDAKQLKLEVETGISTVPDAFKNNEKLDTPAKIESLMKTSIQEKTSGIAEEHIIVYDMTLLVNEDGQGWQEATVDNFPADGLTITIPYPQGTGEKTQEFTACHLFTKDMNGHLAGETEYPQVTNTRDGIQFKVYGLSPVSIGWKDVAADGNKQETKKANGSPATGDHSPIAGYAILMLLAVGATSVVTSKRRRG